MNSWVTGHLTWVGWVHHSWRFGHAEALREVGTEMPGRGWKKSNEQILEFFRRDPSDSLLRLVTMNETRLYHHEPETKQQSMAWRHSGSPWPVPKNSECKTLLGNFSPWFFGIKTASTSSIIFQRAKLSTRSITDLCWCNWKTFWRKTSHRRRATKGVLFLHYNAPALQALATQKKLTYMGLQCPHHPPYSPDLAPFDYHLFPGLKKQLKGPHFSSEVEVIVAVETQLDRQPSEFFFWVACKR